MALRMTSLGHSTFAFETPEQRTLLVDPWLRDNPLCPSGHPGLADVDLALVTHAHHDHLGDLRSVAPEDAPRVVAVAELGNWLRRRGLRRVRTLNVGGVLEVDAVRVTMTPALHSSSLDADPTVNVGVAGGFVLAFTDGTRVYHAGDTAAFAEMALIGELHRPDLALLPMGDEHTMGPEEAALATRLLGVPRVVPMHLGLAPGSDAVPRRFREALDRRGLAGVEVVTLQPGDSLTGTALGDGSSPRPVGHGRGHEDRDAGRGADD